MAAGSESAAMQAFSEKMLEAVQKVEEQLDAQIERLDQMGEDDLEQLRQRRLDAIKKHQAKKQQWLANGHGQYEELPEEKEFFNVTKKSTNVVLHFYRDETFRCKIFDKHLAPLAAKHVETKFCKINAEKCPFLTQRLKIRIIPTLLLVKDSITQGSIVGFTELGNTDNFSSEMLEWRLAQYGMIEYSGDLNTPPDTTTTKTKSTKVLHKKSIRDGRNDDDDEDDSNDW